MLQLKQTLALIIFASIASAQYYGSAIYGDSGCLDADLLYYVLYPTDTCLLDSSSGSYAQATCNSIITEYRNCNSSCSECEEIITTPINECQPYDTGSIQYLCFSSVPAPSGSYYVQYQYENSDCEASSLSEVKVGLNNKCVGGSYGMKSTCSSSSVTFLSCQNGASMGSLPVGTCLASDGTSTLLQCETSGVPAVSPSPVSSPVSEPSASPAPVQNADYWGYSQYMGTSCSGTPYGYITYAKDACVEDELTSAYIKGSCSEDGSSITIYECDSGCGNCVLSSVQDANSCLEDVFVSNQYSCWNTIPQPSTSFVRVATFPQNTSCDIPPVKIVSQPTGCMGGYHTECDGNSVILSLCEDIQCGGSCTILGVTNTTTCAECLGSWYSQTTCYKGGDGSTTDGDSESDNGSGASLMVFNMVIVTLLSVLVA